MRIILKRGGELKIIKTFKRLYYLFKYLSWIDPQTKIGKNCKIGPFAHIREGVILKDNAKIGNAEIKNSIVGKNTKIPHFAYVGDAEIGDNVNIGAGTVICNYDGKKKHKTIIEDGAFIGSNTTLVAPVKIGKNAYVAGGSIINKDVPDYALAIGRARQINKEQWVKLRDLHEMIRKNLEEKGYYEKIKNQSKKPD